MHLAPRILAAAFLHGPDIGIQQPVFLNDQVIQPAPGNTGTGSFFALISDMLNYAELVFDIVKAIFCWLFSLIFHDVNI